MKKAGLLLFSILIFALLCTPAFAAESKGAVIKLPYPLADQDVTLRSQDVEVTVYSTFIEVEAEYEIKNNSENETTAVLGFPVYRHSINSAEGESAPLGLTVTYGKRDSYFVRTKVEGNDSIDTDNQYKEWYMWDVDLRGNGRQRFKMHYYLGLTREDGIPFIKYNLSSARA